MTALPRAATPWHRSPALTNLAALVAGVGLGWFLGPNVEILKPLANAFVNFLTMLSIPFLVVSLVHGFGKLPSSRLVRLGRAGAVSLAAIWVLTIAACFAAAQIFPTIGNTSFYRAPSTEAASGPGLLSVLIPANPFRAVANGVVPGVVFFCLLFAWQLTRVEGKSQLLGWLDVTFAVLLKMARANERVLPLITFVLAASAFGGLDGALIGQLRAYFIAVVVTSLVVGFVLLPAFLGAVSPVGGLRMLRVSLPAMITAFLTGSVFAALPQMTDAAESLLALGPEAAAPAAGADAEASAEAVAHDEEADAEAATIIPIGLNLPTAGSLLTLLYVLFAACAYDRPLSLSQSLKLVVLGVPALFSGSTAAIGYLCELARIPTDAVTLFTGIYSLTERFRGLLSVVSLVSLTVLTHYGVEGRVRLGRLRAVLLALGVLVPMWLACRGLSSSLACPSTIQDYYRARSVDLPPHLSLLRDAQVAPQRHPPSGMARVAAGQPLRVGLNIDRPPFVYRNAKGELSGYSVALVSQLARDLEGKVEIVEVQPGRIVSDLDEGRVDVLLSPIMVTPQRIREVDFCATFADAGTVVMFRDTERDAVIERVEARDWKGARVGVRRGSHLARVARSLLPHATVVDIETVDEMLADSGLQAVLWLDVEAAAWEISNPTYDATPLPDTDRTPLAYPVRIDDVKTRAFLRNWFELARARGDLDRLYRVWVLGEAKGAHAEAPVNRLFEWLVDPST